jgi:hypothetical protein
MHMAQMHAKHILYWIIVAAVALRLLCFASATHIVGTDALVSGDAIGYVQLARNMASHRRFVSSPPDQLITTPEVRKPEAHGR